MYSYCSLNWVGFTNKNKGKAENHAEGEHSTSLSGGFAFFV